METKITIHVRMDRDIHEKLSAKAKELGLTVSAYVRMVLNKDVK